MLSRKEGAKGRSQERIFDKISGTAPIEVSMDVFSESGETHDYLYTNTALTVGLLNVSRLTQEKITGYTINPIYLNPAHWTSDDAGGRIGQSSDCKAQIGVDTKLEVRFDWDVHGRLKELDATYPDSYRSGTPATPHWRAGYPKNRTEF